MYSQRSILLSQYVKIFAKIYIEDCSSIKVTCLGVCKYLQRFELSCSTSKVTCLGVCCSELQLGPHGLDVGLAEDDDGPPAGLHAVYDLVGDHLPGVPVPRVDQTLVLLTRLRRALQT